MKNSIVIFVMAIFFASNSFAAVKKDECFNSISPVMNAIASNYETAMETKIKLSNDFYEVLHQGFFQRLNGISKAELKSERTYKVRLDSGASYDYWEVRVTVEEGIKGCLIRSLKASI